MPLLLPPLLLLLLLLLEEEEEQEIQHLTRMRERWIHPPGSL